MHSTLIEGCTGLDEPLAGILFVRKRAGWLKTDEALLLLCIEQQPWQNVEIAAGIDKLGQIADVISSPTQRYA